MTGKQFFQKLPPKWDFAERNKIEQAYHFAKIEHAEQFRDQGERYFNHPRRVALYVLKYIGLLGYGSSEVTPNMIIAALLHDVVEDCYPPEGMIRNLFGEEVEKWIFGLSKKIPVYDETSGYIIRKIELDTTCYLKKMSKAGADIECVIKMADRLDNLRTMKLVWPKRKQSRYLKETKSMLLIFIKYYHTSIHGDLAEEVEKAIERLKT